MLLAHYSAFRMRLDSTLKLFQESSPHTDRFQNRGGFPLAVMKHTTPREKSRPTLCEPK
ncbi:hypothetical protein TSAR_001983 [Trichomalopsis sarcophagae]|uniref:Uncharacterized protein n=1 Tax=Trichomalopsis sarcophagae TaxID=543379 RepID=A0A232ETS0_9HYME|nr:hypothetical protein TSAR_001983 [Trichomalopsis sarcophagae]